MLPVTLKELPWLCLLLKVSAGSEGWMVPGQATETEPPSGGLAFSTLFKGIAPLRATAFEGGWQRCKGQSLGGLDAKPMPHPVPDQSQLTISHQS